VSKVGAGRIETDEADGPGFRDAGATPGSFVVLPSTATVRSGSCGGPVQTDSAAR